MLAALVVMGTLGAGMMVNPTTPQSCRPFLPVPARALRTCQLVSACRWSELCVLLLASPNTCGCAEMAEALKGGRLSKTILQRFLSLQDSILAPLLGIG